MNTFSCVFIAIRIYFQKKVLSLYSHYSRGGRLHVDFFTMGTLLPGNVLV